MQKATWKMSETYRTEHLKALSNILWLLLRHTSDPISTMPKEKIYKVLAGLQEEMERNTQEAMQRTVRKEITNLLVETRFIDGKVDKLTDMVMDLQRKIGGGEDDDNGE